MLVLILSLHFVCFIITLNWQIIALTEVNLPLEIQHVSNEPLDVL